jgi:tRNA (guanine37-N1)-methyltransferase
MKSVDEAMDDLAYTNASILGRGQKEKKFLVKTYQMRDFVTNKWGKVDERPYGGGPGHGDPS